jgi:cyclopropane-fatty-acyl-phospholipid synthase
LGADRGSAFGVRFLEWRACLRLLAGGPIGRAASYRDGEWTSSDLPTLIEWAARNGD